MLIWQIVVYSESTSIKFIFGCIHRITSPPAEQAQAAVLKGAEQWENGEKFTRYQLWRSYGSPSAAHGSMNRTAGVGDGEPTQAYACVGRPPWSRRPRCTQWYTSAGRVQYHLFRRGQSREEAVCIMKHVPTKVEFAFRVAAQNQLRRYSQAFQTSVS